MIPVRAWKQTVADENIGYEPPTLQLTITTVDDLKALQVPLNRSLNCAP